MRIVHDMSQGSSLSVAVAVTVLVMSVLKLLLCGSVQGSFEWLRT